MNLLAIDITDGTPEKLVGNAYPFAYPYLSNDGSMLVMMDDQNSEDINDTTPVWVVNNTPAVIDSTENTPSSNVTFDGDNIFGVAAWENLSEAFDGDTSVDPLDYVNKSEIKASVWNGTTWQINKLTDNAIADMGPKTAANNGKAAVLWSKIPKREVGEDLLSAAKQLVLQRYIDGAWETETVTIDDETVTEGKTIDLGLSPTIDVQSYDLAMDKNGNILVVYTYRTEDGSNEAGTVYIAADGTVSGQTNLTADTNANSNAKVTTVEVGGTEYFAAAWYSKPMNGSGDIMLQGFDTTGKKADILPTALGVNRANDDPNFSETFSFIKGGSGIAWVNPYDEDTADANEYGVYAKLFVERNGNLELSSAYKIAGGSKYNVIDAIAVTQKNDSSLYTAFEATEYEPVESAEDAPNAEKTLAKQSNIFKATAQIGNIAEIMNLEYNAKTEANANASIDIDMKNAGCTDISSVEIFANNVSQGVLATPIAPNEEKTYNISFTQGETVANVNVYAKVTFSGGDSYVTAPKTAIFVLPDLSIENVMINNEAAEINGQVTVDIRDSGFADLENAKISLNVYEDVERTIPVPVYSDTDLSDITLSSETKTAQVKFKYDLTNTKYDMLNLKMLYLSISITDGDGNEMTESAYTNNADVAVFSNPADVLNKQFKTELTTTENGTSVSAAVTNNMNAPKLIRLILLSKDANGNVIETRPTGAEEVPSNGTAIFEPVTFTEEYSKLEWTIDSGADIPIVSITEDLPKTVNENDVLTVSTSVYPAADVSYQWFKSPVPTTDVTDDGYNAVPIEGATDATYTVSADGETTYYFCKIRAAGGTKVVTGLAELNTGANLSVDNTALATAITNASDLLAFTPIGTVVGNVTQEAYDAYNLAITSAATVRDSASATQAEVDAAVTALATATTTFNDAIVLVGDKTELTTAILDATNLLGSKTIGTAVGNVSLEAYDVYNVAITIATEVKNSISVNQDQVDAAVTVLATATTTFNNAVIVVPSLSGLTISSVTSTSVVFSWDALPNVSSFNIYRANEELGPYTLIGTSAQNSYADSNLVVATNYWYRVSAVMDGEESPQSESLSVTTLNPEVIELSVNIFEASEEEESILIEIVRSGNLTNTVSVDYSTQNGTAIQGEDYLENSGTLTFESDETSKTITISLINDSIYEPDESFSLSLSNPSIEAVIGGNSQATITIKENDYMESTGTIEDLSIEGGFFGIIGDDGQKYRPVKLSRKVKAGDRVSFKWFEDGKIGYHMWGKPIRLISLEVVSRASQPLQEEPQLNNNPTPSPIKPSVPRPTIPRNSR